MKPGDLVQHTSGKLLTVKSAQGGNGMVLCAWMEKDARGDNIECSAAFSWQELRTPTPEEKAGTLAGIPVVVDPSMPSLKEGDLAVASPGSNEALEEAAERVAEPHKRKR